LEQPVAFYAAFFFGTLAPFSLASESPIAIACFRLVTLPPFPPLPDRSVPFFLRRIVLATVLPTVLPYLRLDFFFEECESLLLAIEFSWLLEWKLTWEVVSRTRL